MKILVISQYYKPEPFRISDICEEMVNRGHSVTVVTGIPNYPEGVVYNDYKKRKRRNEIIEGVNIHRSFTIARRNGTMHRFLNYYSFAISSTINVFFNKYKAFDGSEFDVIFVNQLSPIMMAYPAMLYKKIHHKKMILYCLDLWPESLVAGGIKRDSAIYRIFHKISKQIYKSCDHILVTSRMFTNYLSHEFGIERSSISYLPQYAESVFHSSVEEVTEKTTIDLVFAGNIGEAQSVQTIIKAASLLSDLEQLNFHIIGSGTDLENCMNLAKKYQLDNIIFYGRKAIKDMPNYYNIADAMLVSLIDDPILNLTLPGKIQSYMAFGKPIIGSINGETERLIIEAKCGYVSPALDEVKLAENILSFIELSKENKEELAKNAKKYYVNEFSKDIFMKSLENRFFMEKDV